MSQPTLNTDYVDSTSTVNYCYIGKMCIVTCSPLIVTTEKPAGQGYVLVSGLPKALYVCYGYNIDGVQLLINGSGNLTSNNAVPAGGYYVSFAYITK